MFLGFLIQRQLLQMLFQYVGLIINHIFSSFQFDWENSTKVGRRQGEKSYYKYTHVGDTSLVSKIIANVNSESVQTSCYSKPTLISTQQSVSSSKQEKHVSLRLRCVKHQLKNKGLSRKSIQYFEKSWRISTNRKYEFIWFKWHILM